MQTGLVGTSSTNFYLEKGLWSSRAGLVNEENKLLDFFRHHASSELNWMKNKAMGIQDYWGKNRPLLAD
jgi:hypothetical protein